jgi:hypothetical protein
MASPEEIFPCIVPISYLNAVGSSSCIHRPIGNGLVSMLVVDSGVSIRNLSPIEADDLVESIADAWHLAIYNLDQAFQNQRLVVHVMDYPSGGKGVLIGPSYLAPSLLIHPGIPLWLMQLLGAEDLLAVVPERDSAFVYSASAAADVLAGAEKFAFEAGTNSTKPYGRQLFSITTAGIAPAPSL